MITLKNKHVVMSIIFQMVCNAVSMFSSNHSAAEDPSRSLRKYYFAPEVIAEIACGQ